MTPADIRLPMTLEPGWDPDEEASKTDLDETVKRQPLPISESDLDRLSKKAKVTVVNGVRVFGDISNIPDADDVPEYVCCHCVRWDLSVPEDRAEYSEVYAKLAAGATNLVVQWQERVSDQSKLIIYMTYIEILRIAHADQLLEQESR
jgi:hypothetical protein